MPMPKSPPTEGSHRRDYDPKEAMPSNWVWSYSLKGDETNKKSNNPAFRPLDEMLILFSPL